MEQTRLIILEENRLFREELSELIEEQSDLKLVGSFGERERIFPKVHELKPHLLLMDLGLQNRNLNIVRDVKKDLPATKVIAMDLFPMQEDMYDFVLAGISGFILKDASVGNFLKTIRSVARGTSVLPANLMDTLLAQIATHDQERVAIPKEAEEPVWMTKREQQVIELISEGLTNKEIGASLNLSTYTVKSHVHHILEKLALSSRVQIAHHAFLHADFVSAVNRVSLIGK